ncbi:MAG: hypothetical protein E7I45_13105, partial [Eikenella corrodens]|nr:hypothetical protein [Eikenella corrodens]
MLPACCQRLPENGKCPIKHFQVAPSLFSVTHLTSSRLPEKILQWNEKHMIGLMIITHETLGESYTKL